MKTDTTSWNIIAYFLGSLFLVIGILNLIYIHPVPAGIYILISLLYLPPIARFMKQKAGFAISPIILILLAFLVLWFTLGVGDLMEYFESQS
ncbi:MAG: hypothetical protein OEQ81_04695 [Flavobacteriaceae bacterium]|nr:hypothetical protein [Flavobacteriaceae bacterium]